MLGKLQGTGLVREASRGVLGKDIHYETIGYVSGSFKEVSGIVTTLSRLNNPPRDDVVTSCNNRSLVHIFTRVRHEQFS